MRYWMIVLCLCLGLAACGKQKSDDKPDAPPPKTDAPKPEPPVEEPPVAAPDAPTIYVKIDADGSTNMSKLDAPEELATSAKLGATDPGVQNDAVRALRKAGHEAMKDPSIKHDNLGASNAELALTVDGAAKWRYVQWMIQTTASPGIGIRTLEFNDPRGGKPLRILLPTDGGVEDLDEDLVEEDAGVPPSAPTTPKKIKVKMFRRGLQNPPADQFTLIKLGDEEFALPPGPEAHEDDAYWAQMKKLNAALTARIAEVKPTSFELVAPPPKGGSVPYYDVFRVVRMARDLGLQNIVFEGTAMPQER